MWFRLHTRKTNIKIHHNSTNNNPRVAEASRRCMRTVSSPCPLQVTPKNAMSNVLLLPGLLVGVGVLAFVLPILLLLVLLVLVRVL